MSKIKIEVNIKHHRHHKRPKLHWIIGPISEQPQFAGPYIGVVRMNTISLKDTQRGVLNVKKLDKKGFPTDDDFDETPSWSSRDESIARISTAEVDDAVRVYAGNPGTTTIDFNAVNNGVPFSGSAEVIVTPGDVAAVEITAGEVDEQL